MASNTIQFVGIPGCGKSYLFQEYKNRYSPLSFELVEFGQILRERMCAQEDNLGVDYHVTQLIDEILTKNTSAVIASHLVHRTNSGYTWNFKYDLKTQSPAYVHLLTDPVKIRQQISEDNARNTRARECPSCESLDEHQRISLERTIEIAGILNADLLLIHNEPEKLQSNLGLLNKYFCHYLK